MPELPEVETSLRGLECLIVGRKIISVDVRVPKMVKTDLGAFESHFLVKPFSRLVDVGSTCC